MRNRFNEGQSYETKKHGAQNLKIRAVELKQLMDAFSDEVQLCHKLLLDHDLIPELIEARGKFYQDRAQTAELIRTIRREIVGRFAIGLIRNITLSACRRKMASNQSARETGAVHSDTIFLAMDSMSRSRASLPRASMFRTRSFPMARISPLTSWSWVATAILAYANMYWAVPHVAYWRV